MRGRWISVLIVVLMVIGICLAQTRPGHAVLRDAGLFQVPSSYTELAFTAPASLPSQLKSKKARIKVSFGIHNVSGSSQMYRWSIIMVRSGQSHLKASGDVSAIAHGRATIAKTVAIACIGGRLQVIVKLASPAESIDFWAACASHSGSAQ